VRIPRREREFVRTSSSRLVSYLGNKSCLPLLHHGLWADLANPHVLRLLLLQDGAVERSSGLLGAQQQQQGPADGRSRYVVMNTNELLPEMKP